MIDNQADIFWLQGAGHSRLEMRMSEMLKGFCLKLAFFRYLGADQGMKRALYRSMVGARVGTTNASIIAIAYTRLFLVHGVSSSKCFNFFLIYVGPFRAASGRPPARTV